MDPFCHVRLTAINTTDTIRIGTENVPLKDLGRRIRDYRMAKGVCGRVAAEIFGVSLVALYFWETGQYIPKEKYRPRVVAVLTGKVLLPEGANPLGDSAG